MSENYRIRKIHGRLQRAGGSGVKDNPRKLLPLSLNIYRFRLMKSPFLQNLDELPGPVWLFGAYGMTRLGEWSFALLMQCVNGNLRLDGLTAGMQLLGLAGALLPVALLCSLALRNSYGLPLVRWYAGLRVLVHGVAVIAPLVAGYDPEVSGGYAGLVRTEVLNLVRGGLWFGFLCWLERTADACGKTARALVGRRADGRTGALRNVKTVVGYACRAGFAVRFFASRAGGSGGCEVRP